MDDPWLALVRARLRAVLDGLTRSGLWHDDGDQRRGLASFAVRLARKHSDAAGQVDIGFYLDRADPSAPVRWDCVSGHTSAAAGADLVARIWIT